MKLLVVILSKSDRLPVILEELIAAGVHGTTVVDCEGMAKVIGDAGIDPPPVYGSLRHYLNRGLGPGKMMFIVLPAEQVGTAKKIVDRAVGGIDEPDSGIMFTVPLDSVEGLTD